MDHKKEAKCLICGQPLDEDTILSMCKECEDEGWDVDPAGGICGPDEEPWKQYE